MGYQYDIALCLHLVLSKYIVPTIITLHKNTIDLRNVSKRDPNQLNYSKA